MKKAVRLMIVEDDAFLAFDLKDQLEEMGFDVVGLAHTLKEAMTLAEGLDVDVAVLDVNLRGERSLPAARRLKERAVPFLFITGYGRGGLDDDLQDVAVLAKPVSMGTLSSTIQGLVEQNSMTDVARGKERPGTARDA